MGRHDFRVVAGNLALSRLDDTVKEVKTLALNSNLPLSVQI